jgi:hypothetical protein
LGFHIDVAIARAMQPGLRSNRNLQILDLSSCYSYDEGFHLIVEALVGNTTMEVLGICYEHVGTTLNALVDDINRLVEFAQMKAIRFGAFNRLIFYAANFVQRFVSVLSRHTSLEELPGVYLDAFPVIKSLLARNVSIRHAKELLALQPGTRLPIGSKSGIWPMAMSKLAPDSAGASAIFHILLSRPALLEKQLRRRPRAHEPLQQGVARRRGVDTASSGERKEARFWRKKKSRW